MDEINDNMENMRQIQDLLSAPMGAAADFDEVSLPPSLPTYLWAHMRVSA
jgi:charged multivesicular body protein 4